MSEDEKFVKIKVSELENLVDKKVKKRLEKEKGFEHKSKSSSKISRRNFLKKVGAGAIGLGALSLSPVSSQMKITKNGIFGANSNQKLNSFNQISSEKIKASKELRIPTSKNTENDNQIWIDKDNQKLKISVNGNKYETSQLSEILDTNLTEIDFFEDGDISEYGGDTSNFTVQSQNGVTEGSNALECQGAGTSSVKFITSNSGLSHYPQIGDRFRYTIMYDSNPNDLRICGWCQQGSETQRTEAYTVVIENNRVAIEREGSSIGNSTLSGKSVDMTAYNNKQLEIEVSHYEDNVIEATVYDGLKDNNPNKIATLSGSDSNLTSGGVTHMVKSSANVYLDRFGIVQRNIGNST